MRASSGHAGWATRRKARNTDAPISDDVVLPSLRESFAAAVTAFIVNARMLLTVSIVAAGLSVILRAPLGRLLENVATVVAATAIASAADCALAHERVDLVGVYRRGITRFFQQFATMLSVLLCAFLLVVIAFELGGAPVAAARYLSTFSDTIAAVEQAIVWTVMIAAGMAMLIPFGLLAAFTSIGVALEDDTPWMSATRAAGLIFGPCTRRYILWFGIVSALLVPLAIGVTALSRFAGAALHAPLLPTILRVVIGWPLGMMTLLFTVRVWRRADGTVGNGTVTTPSIASWRIQAGAFAALCILIYAIAHPHFGEVWSAQTPFSSMLAPVLNAPEFPSETACLRETQLPLATPPFEIRCIKHQGFSFAW